MKLFALVNESNVVLNVSIADDNWTTEGWVEYNETNPAFIGGDLVDGYFYPPQPYPSWTRFQGNWNSPTPYPTDDKLYTWDEATTSWLETE